MTAASWAEGVPGADARRETSSSAWTEGSVCRMRGQVATSRGTFNISAGICANFFLSPGRTQRT